MPAVSHSSFSPITAEPIRDWIRQAGRRLGTWVAAYNAAAEAAALYEQLCRLSDAELERRGLSRATLASDIARECDRINV